MSLFDRIKASLVKTKEQFLERLDEIAQVADTPESRSRPIDVDTLDALEELLIGAEVGVAASDASVAAVKANRTPAALRATVHAENRRVLDTAAGAPPSAVLRHAIAHCGHGCTI